MSINQWVDLISDICVGIFCLSGTIVFLFGFRITSR